MLNKWKLTEKNPILLVVNQVIGAGGLIFDENELVSSHAIVLRPPIFRCHFRLNLFFFLDIKQFGTKTNRDDG